MKGQSISTSFPAVAVACRVLALPAVAQSPEPPEVPPADPAEVKVPEGYEVHLAVRDLDYPTSAEFDAEGNLYIAEAGYSYGDESAKPRVLRVSKSGEISTLAGEGLVGPVNDLLWHDGKLLVSHRGKISVIENGALRDLVSGLPSEGDHQNNQMTVGPDGKLYLGQGTLTNSGVVGPDNAHMGWLKKHPDLHDVPAETITVSEKVFESKNPLEPGSGTARTMPYHAFNSGAESKTVEGRTKASGTILRMDPDGGNLQVYASGLRNPYGVLWSPDGKLYATENGMDVRGSRPVANDKDDLYQIKEGAWYGWPDFASGIPITDPRFAVAGGPQLEFVLVDHPPVEKPVLTFPVHSAATKLAVSPGGAFGHGGHLFIAFFGHLSPMTGKTEEHGGHRVVEVDPATMSTTTFFSKAGGHHGGEEGGHAHSGEAGGKGESVTAGPRRLMDVSFTKDGGAMYIVDFGTMVVKSNQPVPVPGTGVVWRVVPEGAGPAGLPAGLSAKNPNPAAQ